MAKRSVPSSTKVIAGRVISTFGARSANANAKLNQTNLDVVTVKSLIQSIQDASTSGLYIYEVTYPIIYRKEIEKYLKSKKFSVAYYIRNRVISYLIYWGPDKKLANTLKDHNKMTTVERFNSLRDHSKPLSDIELLTLDDKEFKIYYNNRRVINNKGVKLTITYKVL